MVKKAHIFADMHTHTIFSDHAYSTIKENITVAKRRNIDFLAVTDHYYNDGTDIQKKNETTRIRYLEERINSCEDAVSVIGGAEFNLNQEMEHWDKIKGIKWRIIGLHSWFVNYKKMDLSEVYKLFENASDGRFTAFAHIERELHKVGEGRYMVDNNGKPIDLHPEIKEFLIAVCDLAKKKDIFLEVNESTLVTAEGKNPERLKFWLQYAKENGNRICLGTDAHYCEEVGKFTKALYLLNKYDFPEDRILNCDVDAICELKGL